MRWPMLIVLVTMGSRACAQLSTGAYSDWFGHEIEINADSSFQYGYHFDLITDRSQGRWTMNGDTLALQYMDVSDVYVTIDSMPMFREGSLRRVGYPRHTIAPSLDNKVDTIHGRYEKLCCPGSGMRPTRLYVSKDRLILLTEKGKVIRRKGHNINGKRVPSYFQRHVE